MENIVDNSLVVRVVKDIRGKEISIEAAENLMLEMEEELKDVLFNHGSLNERYKNKVKPEYIGWVKNDSVYQDAVKKYIEGKVSPEVIEKVPYFVAILLVKHTMEKM